MLHRCSLLPVMVIVACTSGTPSPSAPLASDAAADASTDGSQGEIDAQIRDGATSVWDAGADALVQDSTVIADRDAATAHSALFHLLGNSGGSGVIESFRLTADGTRTRIGSVTAPAGADVLGWSDALGQLFTAGPSFVASLRATGDAPLALLDEATLDADDRATDLVVLGAGRWLLRAGERSLTVVGASADGTLTPKETTTLKSTTLRRIATRGAEVYSAGCEERLIERRTFNATEGVLGAPAPLFRAPAVADAPEGESGVVGLAVHPAGGFLLALSSDGKISSFSLADPLKEQPVDSLTYTPTGQPSQFCGPLERIEIHPSGKLVYVTTDSGNAVAVLSFDPMTGRLGLLGHVAYFAFRGASLLSAHASGRHLVVGDNAGRFNVFEIASAPDLLKFVSAGPSSIIYVLDVVQAVER